MPKKVMILASSPNKNGNTNTLVRWIIQGIKDTGGTADFIDTAHLKYKSYGCTACMACQRSKKFKCVIKDKASKIIAKIPAYDVLIFATPLYFFGPTAQLKVFMDRMYSLYKFDLMSGKIRFNHRHMTFVLVSTAGSDMFTALKQTFEMYTGFSHLKFKSLLIPNAGQPGDLKKNFAVRKKAIAFGQSL